jgi:hypothetical protein
MLLTMSLNKKTFVHRSNLFNFFVMDVPVLCHTLFMGMFILIAYYLNLSIL